MVVVYPIDERQKRGVSGGLGGWKRRRVRAGSPHSRIYYFVTKPFLAL